MVGVTPPYPPIFVPESYMLYTYTFLNIVFIYTSYIYDIVKN